MRRFVKHMNILIITKSAWDDRIASGNTLSNLFTGWRDAKFYCLYSRDASPNNEVCQEYYSISPISILKHFFQPKKIGKRFSVATRDSNNPTFSRETVLIDKAKRSMAISKWIYYAIYATNLWLNKSFKKFIEDSKPDVVFCFGQTDPLTYKAVQYIKHNTQAKIISYYVDHLYHQGPQYFNFLNRIENHRLLNIAKFSDKCYAISEKMCIEYSELYSREFMLLHKGCEVCQPKTSLNSPVRLLYAGNLYYNRDKVLIALASAIKRINQGTNKARLDIYSGSRVSAQTLSALNIPDSSTLHKARPYDEVKELMKESDIVLHVESFDKKEMDRVRLSFSTKITDCMQSGSMMLAIGPSSVSSIDYAIRVPGCVVVDNLNDLDTTLRSLINSTDTIIHNSLIMNKYVKENVEICKNRERLREEFVQLL